MDYSHLHFTIVLYVSVASKLLSEQQQRVNDEGTHTRMYVLCVCVSVLVVAACP